MNLSEDFLGPFWIWERTKMTRKRGWYRTHTHTRRKMEIQFDDPRCRLPKQQPAYTIGAASKKSRRRRVVGKIPRVNNRTAATL